MKQFKHLFFQKKIFYSLFLGLGLLSCNKLQYTKDVVKDGVGVQMKKRVSNAFEEKEIETTRRSLLPLPNNINVEFADPKVDMSFKMLLGDERNKAILINFLNHMLEFKGSDQIKDVTLTPTNLPKSSKNEISSEVDVLCTTKNNRQINIEMQRKSNVDFLPRIQHYMARLIGNKTKIGQGRSYYKNIYETYILVIAEKNFKDFPHDDYEHHYAPCNTKTNELMPYNKMFWVFFELEKFKSKVNSNDIRQQIKLQWLHFFANCNNETKVPEFITEDKIKDSYNLMYNILQDPHLKMQYENSLLRAREIANSYIIEGMRIGEIKGEIKMAKKFIKKDMSYEEEDFNFLKESHFQKIQEENWLENSNTQILEEFQKGSQKIMEEEYNPDLEEMGIGKGFAQPNNQYNK